MTSGSTNRMDFEAESWDVGEEADELSNLLFTATPVLSVNKKNKKKSLERNQQKSYRSSELEVRGNSNNDKDKHNVKQSANIAGKNKVSGNVEELILDNPSKFDEDSHSNQSVLNKKTAKKKKDSWFDKSGLQQNAYNNDQNYAIRGSCNLVETDNLKKHKKKCKLEKSENGAGQIKGSKDINHTEGTKFGKQPKKKTKKNDHEQISLSPSEEKSSSTIDNLPLETSFETIDEDWKSCIKQNSKDTSGVQEDKHEVLSHSKNKKKRKHVLSNDGARIEAKKCQEKNSDTAKIHRSNETKLPSNPKKKRKAETILDIYQNTIGNMTNEGTKTKDTDLKNKRACNESEMSSEGKKKTGQQSEYQVCDELILCSHENDNTRMKRKRKKKDKSMSREEMNDIKHNLLNNNQYNISSKDEVVMEDTDVESSEDVQTLETSDTNQIKKEDVFLKEKMRKKKLKLRHLNESLNEDNKRAKVTDDKKDSRVSDNKKDREGTEDLRSHSKHSLPFTPQKIKELLAKEAEQSWKKTNNSTVKPKNLQKTEKQSIHLNFNRSKSISEDSLTYQTNQKPIAKDKDGKTKSLLEQNKGKLEAARFRFINEQLYTRTGAEALELFNDDPEAFEVYHKGFQNQVEKWPVNPVDVIIDYVTSLPSSTSIADFGCGDAKLAQSVSNKVHSFDLVAMNKHVTVCDIANVPLPDHSVDVAVFCLSLMGTNFSTYLAEANRVLKKGGTLIVAEVASRFHRLTDFLGDLKRLGFKSIEQDTKNEMFILMTFEKKSTLKKTVIKQMKLKPCVYKKR